MLEQKCKKIEIEKLVGAPEKIFGVDFDFEKIKKLIDEKMVEEKINSKIQKILLSLQKSVGKTALIGTIFISGLGIIKIVIDLEKMELVEFKKRSFLDIVNVFKKKS